MEIFQNKADRVIGISVLMLLILALIIGVIKFFKLI